MGWRSRLKLLLWGLWGIGLTVVFYGCQPQVPQAQSLETSVPALVEVFDEEQPLSVLPAPTQAIVNAVPGGLYNPPRGDARFVVISDLNSAYGSTDYDPEVDQGMALIPFWQPDLVLCSGDMVAGQDRSLSDEQIRAMWQAFDRHVAAPLRSANLPFGFTVGNHDASAARTSTGDFIFQREREMAQAYWQDPVHTVGVQFVDRFEFPFYYTFEQQGVFFLVWDGSSHHIPADKLAWVERSLASEAAQSAKVRILIGHLPLYGVAAGRDRPFEVMENAEDLRVLLERYQVHTYISGHHHAYYPAHRGNLQLLHTGILGSGPRPFINSQTPTPKTITVLDVNFNTPDLTTYTTYDMKTLEVIDLQALPRFLVGHNGLVLRRDVDRQDLTAEEIAGCARELSATLCST